MSQSVGFRNLGLRVFPALLALVVLASLTVSCSQDDTDTDAKAGSGDTASPDLLGLVPDGYQEVTRWDVAGLLDAEGLEETQDNFREQWEWTEQYGIFMDDVDELLRARDYRDATLVFFAGQFDWDSLRDDLDQAGLRDDTYRDVEVWEDRLGDVVVGLLVERNQVILSISRSFGVRDTIRALDRGGGFLFEEKGPELARALGQITEGLHTTAEKGCSRVDVRGCRAVAYSARQGGGPILH